MQCYPVECCAPLVIAVGTFPDSVFCRRYPFVFRSRQGGICKKGFGVVGDKEIASIRVFPLRPVSFLRKSFFLEKEKIHCTSAKVTRNKGAPVMRVSHTFHMMFNTQKLKTDRPDAQNRPRGKKSDRPHGLALPMLLVRLKLVGPLACAQRCKIIFRLKIKALLGVAAER